MTSAKDTLNTTNGKPLACLYYLRDKTVKENNQINKCIRDPEGHRRESDVSDNLLDEHLTPAIESSPLWGSANFDKTVNGSSTSEFMSRINSLDCWDYTIELECLQGPQDLQLAAELGKTLLERNKELETTLKHYISNLDDKNQEIIYLQKQTAALREVNDSRLKVYEQLEVGVQEIERSNHRLNVENAGHKKQLKLLLHNIETLESRCEELTKNLEDTKLALAAERRKNERLLEEKNVADKNAIQVRLQDRERDLSNSITSYVEWHGTNTSYTENCSLTTNSVSANQIDSKSSVLNTCPEIDSCFLSSISDKDNEEIIQVVSDLETTKKALLAERQRVGELEDQLFAMIRENKSLQGQLAQNTSGELKSVHEEFSVLEEVRQGNMCSRCLRSCDDRLTVQDEASSIAPTEDDEDRSLLEMEQVANIDSTEETSSQIGYYRPTVSIKVAQNMPPDSLDLSIPDSHNPFRDLVEKYEALIGARRPSPTRLKDDHDKSIDDNIDHDNAQNNTTGKNNRRTPTEFSEAETSSSGFSDETSNKATQTDDRPGFFLCSIGDGEDCKFSIYDDASPIDSRFRNRPEYRELFKEIFAVLKKAAENKEEGEKLPLLDDANPPPAKVPPVTPANEEMPPMDFGDDTQSIISSVVSEQSIAMSECITKLERKTAKKHIIVKNQENQPPCVALADSTTTTPTSKHTIFENGRILTPLKREPLDHLIVGAGTKKKNKKKSRNFGTDRSDSPAGLPTPPKYYVSGKRRRDAKPINNLAQFATGPTATNQQSGKQKKTDFQWNGSSMIVYNRTSTSVNASATSAPSRKREINGQTMEYKPSTVSQDLHKLKTLDLSYAEVLRRADICQHFHRKM